MLPTNATTTMMENNQQPYLYTMPPLYCVATRPIIDSSVCSPLQAMQQQ